MGGQEWSVHRLRRCLVTAMMNEHEQERPGGGRGRWAGRSGRFTGSVAVW